MVPEFLTKIADDMTFQLEKYYWNFEAQYEAKKNPLMTKTTFQIQETEGCIELVATGELTVCTENSFRLNLLKLLMHGKSKSYKLNLRGVETMDTSCIQLVHILNRQLVAVNASLIVDMPQDSGSHTFQRQAGFPKKWIQSR